MCSKQPPVHIVICVRYSIKWLYFCAYKARTSNRKIRFPQSLRIQSAAHSHSYICYVLLNLIFPIILVSAQNWSFSMSYFIYIQIYLFVYDEFWWGGAGWMAGVLSYVFPIYVWLRRNMSYIIFSNAADYNIFAYEQHRAGQIYEHKLLYTFNNGRKIGIILLNTCYMCVYCV